MLSAQPGDVIFVVSESSNVQLVFQVNRPYDGATIFGSSSDYLSSVSELGIGDFSHILGSRGGIGKIALIKQKDVDKMNEDIVKTYLLYRSN